MRFTLMESNPKEMRFENDEGIDRISELPDSILCKILSYLPTKYVIVVSILSTRWRNLYPFGFLPITLTLDDSLLLNPRENNVDASSNFMDFVDKLLNQTLSDVPCVEKVLLKCQKNYGDANVASWVCAALRLNVRHLDLEFSLNESMTLFHCISGCTTLVTLRLSSESELSVPDNFSLPNLKSLDLARLTLYDEVSEPIKQLTVGCPALEYLYLVGCDLTHLCDVCIESPLLKNLVIENSWEESIGYLTIDAPRLEVFMYHNPIASAYSVCNFNSLHTAHVDIGPTQRLLEYLEEVAEEENDDEDVFYFDIAAKIVSRCSSTVRQYLSDRTIHALNQSFKPLPVFQNLTWLSLGCLQWSLLARLLSSAPYLEQLHIEEGFQESEEGFAHFKNFLPIPPECLVLHVKKIEFCVFEGDDDEMKLVEYFLKNGEVLQKLVLHCLPPDDMSVLTGLLMLPRQSTTCQIECTRK